MLKSLACTTDRDSIANHAKVHRSIADYEESKVKSKRALHAAITTRHQLTIRTTDCHI